MKRKSLTTILLILCILGLATILTACGRNCFVGSRTAEADSYRLDIDRMTGSDRFTMELCAGDTLAVQFETVKGSIRMEIKEPDKSSLYAGNGKGVSEFTVNIPESGTYSFYVEARHAKGTVYIQQIDGKNTLRN
ncbi:MAG: hypothetical protein PUA72_04435 [Lachnospiraceae bacterium]|nr:hypothetical protein [Lachnospiraceae bacterium]